MSLDGKIATHSGDSRWISNEQSRAVVHRLRGRMDAILVGAGTALRDDPLLTARPAGPRVATRIVVDSTVQIPLNSRLIQSAREVPLLVAATPAAATDNVRRLEQQGAEVLILPLAADGNHSTHAAQGIDLHSLFQELGRRRFTNVLVEGGSRLFGSLFDSDLADEVHVFVAPKIVGGSQAVSAVAGHGNSFINEAVNLGEVHFEQLADDVYINARRPSLFGRSTSA
jgi:diaminohydroxyphosphoribosylaminopyrimidine deaminase / 5-amino-6-(5-phosphoribosylamino)uracil reductase